MREIKQTAADLPSGAALARHVRRPGDSHDAMGVPDYACHCIEKQAEQERVPAALAATLLTELYLLEQDLVAAVFPTHSPPAPLIQRRLSEAESRYLRALTWRRPGFAAFGGDTVAMPVRVLARSASEILVAASECDLSVALCWEAAAVAAGRTLGEFGLFFAALAARATT